MASDEKFSESGFTQEEIMMLDKRRASRLAGKSELLSEEEALEQIRQSRQSNFTSGL